ncbi:hypothetical protein FQN57_006427 [Myotisia sp. PD_48]|nr:hypothetical protein FQN57_006427 [Myotisia sp. PD_48]
MEELLARHRKEQRDLQSRITQKKKSATKKSRKGVNGECDGLQRDLLEKQQVEIAQFNGQPTEALMDAFEELTIEVPPVQRARSPVPAPDTTGDEQSAASFTSESNKPRRGNRHKARLARRAAEQEADAEQAAEEAAGQTDHRENEQIAMNEAFSRLGLKEKDITPDGHCLYSAVASQLKEINIELGSASDDPMIGASKTTDDDYRTIRAVTARFILSHQDDFAPFLEEPILEYTRKIRSTAEWGGQLELQAIAQAYNVRVNVVQGDGRIEKFQPRAGRELDDAQFKDIWLAYYRHTYSLGEHYNALSQRS